MKTTVQSSPARSAEPDTGRARPLFFRAGVQAKLRVGRSGDRFETEADAAADGVVHARGPFARNGPIAPHLTPTVQRRPEEEQAQTTPIDAESRAPMEDELQRQEKDNENELQTRAEPDDEEVQSRLEDDDKLQTRAANVEEVQSATESNDEELRTRPDEETDEIQSRGEAEEEDVRARSGLEEDEVRTRPEPRQLREPRPMAWVERRLRASRGLGNPLPEAARRRMEANFGRDLSGIRIHTDQLAVELSRALRAQAFAHGRNIYFNEGRFTPGTNEGDHLLAHEIAHTIQQGAVKERVVQLLPDDDPDVMWVRPEALEAIRLARSKEGLINTKLADSEGNRIGWRHLHEIFRTAFGGDTIHPDVVRKITMIKKPPNGPGKEDALPHWCGLFAWWALKTAGVPLPDWKIGMNILQFVEPRPPGSLPQKGDIAYRRKNDHFALVSGLESSATAAGKPVGSVQVRTVNGNTAGSDNLGGQVEEKWGPISEWLTFFDPMSKMPLPEVPLVKTTRDPEDVGEAPPEETGADEAAATEETASAEDQTPTEEVPPTPEAVPGAETEIPLDLPPPAPLPPQEPVAKVEKLDLAGSSEEAMAGFVAAPASVVAATGPELAGALDGKIADEQTEAEHEVPELRAQTGGDVDPGITPPGEIPTPAGAEVGDGVTGATPADLVAEPHQDKAPPPSNAETEKLMDRQPEGSFLDWLRGAIGNLMARIRTTDPGVSTSAGPRQNVSLEGEADPERMTRQREDGANQLRAQRDTRVAAFKNHPGQSNIAPRRIDEARKPAMKTEPAAPIEPTPPSSDAADYVDAQYPKEVRDKADADLASTLEPGLQQAGTGTREAATTRDTDSRKEKDAAVVEARRINESADAEQKRAVLEGRQDVARQQGEGVAGAYEKVTEFSDDAAKEQSAQRKAVGDHVTSEQGKARRKLEDGEKEAEKKKKEKEAEAAAKKQELEKDQKKESWWDRAANFVKKAVEKVTAAIDTIFTALREAVATIIEKAKQAAVGLINAARNWVVDKLNGFRDWAKSQVDKYLKESFPGLASAINDGIDATVDVAINGVNLAADTAIAGVEALADSLAAALDKILAAYQAALKAAVQIAGAVVTGDFAEALKIAIRAACDIAGIDSKPIFDFLDRAGSLIAEILKDPVPFINNLMSAVGQGVRSFGENILAHLQKGLIEWLTGALTEAGITLPKKFDLLGIFSLVAQILGLTYANVKARIIKKLPAAEKVFDVVEKGFALVMKLRDLDFSGLWEEAKAALANLKETIIGGIRNWVVTMVIKEGIIWLLSLLNPASAIVKALKLLFDLAMWLIERFEQIKDFVLSVYDGVAKIAAGVLGPAAKAVEDALARALPVVISMVASMIGLGGIGKAVKELLEKITAPINKVIDAVIDKVIAFAKKLIGKVKSGAKKAKEAITDFLWPKKSFSAGDESHTLYFSDTGKPMIRSSPQALSSFIKAWESQSGAKASSAKKNHLKAAKATLGEITKLAANIEKDEKAGKKVSKAKQQKMLQLQTSMSQSLKGMLGGEHGLAKARERYLLEGLTGTYGTIPKPKGDDLTGDHQPQAAVIKLLAGRPYFKKGDAGKEMHHRAAGSHADNAYVINLQGKRHAAGRTYGSKGKATKAALTAKVTDMESKETDDAQRRKKAVGFLKTDLAADVSAMRSVYTRGAKDPIWADLDKFVSDDDDKETLVGEIRTRVNKGETVIANQPMNSLAG